MSAFLRCSKWFTRFDAPHSNSFPMARITLTSWYINVISREATGTDFLYYVQICLFIHYCTGYLPSVWSLFIRKFIDKWSDNIKQCSTKEIYTKQNLKILIIILQIFALIPISLIVMIFFVMLNDQHSSCDIYIYKQYTIVTTTSTRSSCRLRGKISDFKRDLSQLMSLIVIYLATVSLKCFLCLLRGLDLGWLTNFASDVLIRLLKACFLIP